jgi:rhamnosyltransferase
MIAPATPGEDLGCAAVSGSPCVVAIVVCYRPDVSRLRALCERLTADCHSVVLVDNSEEPYLTVSNLPSLCQLLTLGFNSGIAHAQNEGVSAARRAGANVLAFFDQDSTVEKELLPRLVAALHVGVPHIVAPLCLDDTTGQQLPSEKFDAKGRASSIHNGAATRPYDVDIVISSGTVATQEVFDVAGGFDAGLFIDFVDTEWCCRCRSHRIPIQVVPSALMRHRIGTRSIRIGRKTVMVHSPVRCYYQIRNCLLLFRMRHVPVRYVLRIALSVISNRLILLLHVDNCSGYVRAYLSGLRDGIRGIAGPKPN